MGRFFPPLPIHPFCRVCLWCGLIGLLSVRPSETFAQRYQVLPGPNEPRRPRVVPRKEEPSPASNTIVSVEIIAGQGVGYHAQMWGPVFEHLGISAQIRRGRADEKPEIQQGKLGGFRQVKVIGQLDRQGRIVLPDRVFTRDQATKLGEYLKELKTFGGQGNPAGQPLWGLDAEQFGEFYKAFSEKVTKPAKDKPLTEAIKDLEIPEEYPINMSRAAKDRLASEFPNEPASRQSLEGFSRGTAFAMLLNDYGLGFRPVRTAAGKIEIGIEPLKDSSRVWPVGWEPKESRQKTAPALFTLIPIDLEDVPLVDVLNAVSTKSKVPVRYDHYRIEANDLEMSKMKVSYPPRQTSFSLLLRGITNPNLLAYDLKIDELGQPFIWITTLKLGKLGR